MIQDLDADSRDSFEVYDADTLRRMRRAKWALGTERYGAAIAEMDFVPAAPIGSALVDAVRRGDVGYQHPQALDSASGALKSWMRNRYAWRLASADIVPVGGLLRALEASVLFFMSSKKPVIVPTPAYPPFLSVPHALGLDVVESPMHSHDGRWSLDLADIDRAFSEGAGLLILCNPHNPTGTVFSHEELGALAEVVEAHGGRVFSDEIHAPLAYPETVDGRAAPSHIPYATVSAAAAGHALTGVSVTKGWNLGGINCAHLIVSERDRPTANRLHPMLAHSASTPGLWATAAAYSSGERWLRETLTYLDHNRLLLAHLIDEHLPGVGYRAPDATYLAWLDFRETSWADRPALQASQRAGVATNEGTDFGSHGNGFLRLNFATPSPVLKEIIEAMGAAFSSSARKTL
ncbi:Cystathionine beta-lyase [Arthrobacter sp. Bi83]|uniref:MalY/PatB family protein n=1 Tax=Arthrobacter sp. Bi83 TaxID=2822353 RepID=UPI001DA9BEF3|nr:aminotransferase class I/II-fold pyridoxal phosphate-dependent enzyme [Arthrobacter sp. Bi83]CAH0218220.1 Cystathionine beta-lyase [Arthrobacter sp. Bi83]